MVDKPEVTWQCDACGLLNEETLSPYEWLTCRKCSALRPYTSITRKASPPPPLSDPPPIPEVPRDEHIFVPDTGSFRNPPTRIRKSSFVPPREGDMDGEEVFLLPWARVLLVLVVLTIAVIFGRLLWP